MREVLIVGGTGGIGGEAARRIAEGGSRVWIVGRNRDRGEAAVQDLRSRTGVEHHYLPADMANMADVARLADTVNREIPRLDVLVHAAGVITWERQTGSDGVEMMFGTHVLARMLLTERILPRLEAAPSPRMVIISSQVAPFVRYDPDKLMATHRFTALGRLQHLQLANHLWAGTLSDRHPGMRTTVHLVHPGIVETSVFQALPRLLYATLRILLTPVRVPVSVAASNVVALVEGGASSHGTLHFRPGQLDKQRPVRRDAEAAADLWRRCDALLAERELGPGARP